MLRKIPANTTKHDIIDYLAPALKGKFYQKHGEIEDIQIMVIKNGQGKNIHIHALVTINSDAAAERVITKLNRKAFNGKHIAIREYFYRSWHNDPRTPSPNTNNQLAEKRIGDRRRSKLEVLVQSHINTDMS